MNEVCKYHRSFQWFYFWKRFVFRWFIICIDSKVNIMVILFHGSKQSLICFFFNPRYKVPQFIILGVKSQIKLTFLKLNIISAGQTKKSIKVILYNHTGELFLRFKELCKWYKSFWGFCYWKCCIFHDSVFVLIQR